MRTTGEWTPSHCGCHVGAKNAKCKRCKKPIAMDKRGWRATKILVREIRTSEFRGDDVVQFAHASCWVNQHNQRKKTNE